jgi:hypothetical protein
MRKQYFLRVALAIVILSIVFAPGDGGPPPAEKGWGAAADDPLASLNDASRAAYRRAREEALARCGPVVLLEGDDLVLVYGLYRSKAHFAPDLYHTLKTISHIPLALHALLAGRDEGALDDKRLYDLKQYRESVVGAGKVIGERGLSDEQLRRQKTIIDDSLKFLSAVIEGRHVDRKELDGYRQRMRPLLEANVAEAARSQIDALHRQMKAWKARLTDAEWRRLRVIVMGTQMPRKDNLAVQYFSRLLGEPGEGGRIVYAEALFDESKALDLLGTRIVDSGIGSAFFNDSRRMNRDLLGDAAAEYLNELFDRAP